MEMKTTHETICLNEVVFDGTLEQSIELDYILPDYCECIFKVLKCRVIPKVTSERIVNGKLTVDGIAEIKVFYVSDENYHVRCITQKQAFCVTQELKESHDNACIIAVAKCSYVNCRVVNERRIDIRGAVSVKSTVSVERQINVLNSASGMGLQICNQKVTALDKVLHACKDFTITEELELGYGKAEITEILDCTANVVLTECKIIANKIILKGEIMLHILYCSINEKSPEIMEYSIPISQIVDIMGITEEYKCNISFDVTGVELNPMTNSDGECKLIDAEICVRVRCEANKNSQANLICDAYSTNYEMSVSSQCVKVCKLLDVINESCICKTSFQIPQGEICCVYDISCEFVYESCKLADNCITILGNLCTNVLALDNEKMPILIEKKSVCELKIGYPCDMNDIAFSPSFIISSVSYSLLSANELEIRADVKVCGVLYQTSCYDVINEINVNEMVKKEREQNVVLRLYYANKNERIWDIAKRFNTSMEAIMAENNLEAEALSDKCMLLIPIIC